MGMFNGRDLYAILIEDDNSMTITRKRRIVQGSNLVDHLCFLVNPEYNGHNMEDFDALLNYVSPISLEMHEEFLCKSSESYKNLLAYVLPFDSKITDEAGSVDLILTFRDHNNGERVRNITGVTIDIVSDMHQEEQSPNSGIDEVNRQIARINKQIKEVSNEVDAKMDASNPVGTGSFCMKGVGWFQDGIKIGGNSQDDGSKTVLVEGDAITVPENAAVGQTTVVKSVDENGRPTEWKSADMVVRNIEDVTTFMEKNLTVGFYFYLSNPLPNGYYYFNISKYPGKLLYAVIVNNEGTAVDKQFSLGRPTLFHINSNESEIIITEADNNGIAWENVYDIANKTHESYVVQYPSWKIDELLEKRVLSPESAAVGQVIVVKSVDENGKPIEWECVDSPTGGSTDDIYVLKEGETIDNAPEEAVIVIDPFNDSEPDNSTSKIVNAVLSALPTWTGGSF